MTCILALSSIIGVSFIFCSLKVSSEATKIEEYQEITNKLD